MFCRCYGPAEKLATAVVVVILVIHVLGVSRVRMMESTVTLEPIDETVGGPIVVGHLLFALQLREDLFG